MALETSEPQPHDTDRASYQKARKRGEWRGRYVRKSASTCHCHYHLGTTSRSPDVPNRSRAETVEFLSCLAYTAVRKQDQVGSDLVWLLVRCGGGAATSGVQQSNSPAIWQSRRAGSLRFVGFRNRSLIYLEGLCTGWRGPGVVYVKQTCIPFRRVWQFTQNGFRMAGCYDVEGWIP
ncbi:hypothetical protein ASPVEDRAFT_379616 [Aspergillus versicolor CBS 583.65]|uniref:Uncharacterized protein n=1 Tax=Aspergillus versicolor CBS 583.65 TaxID=1036611 RepID=A0A1L9Q2L9_ASPVE|nr:uncharacterized protein ASPVEDRAFT_379616 [Aspergillus versicolor CBS 583.65]OJJ07981.1 hypothetical protein ASPVEDRAFT_379616 [Aspergillus versicolor CBS 583.65]